MGKIKSNTDEIRIKYCTICKKEHPITEDGLDYLDCMLFYKKGNDKKEKFSKDNKGWSFLS